MGDMGFFLVHISFRCVAISATVYDMHIAGALSVLANSPSHPQSAMRLFQSSASISSYFNTSSSTISSSIQSVKSVTSLVVEQPDLGITSFQNI